MTIEKFNEIEDSVLATIKGTLEKVKNNSSSDFILLLARASYNSLLERPELNLSPYVLEDSSDLMIDITRQKFLVKYITNYTSRLKSGEMPRDEDKEYELNIQMMMYSHIWESILFLKQMERITRILNGKGYLWDRPFNDKLKKGSYIKNNIIDQFKAVDEDMYKLLEHCYSKDLRNDFAHSTYHIQMGSNQICSFNNGLFCGAPLSVDEWEVMFLESVLLSYHLNDLLIILKKGLIENVGKGPYPIKLPKKGCNGQFLNAYIYPEYVGDTNMVQFSFVMKDKTN